MKKQQDYITIGELSKLTGVNAKSLRYYERIGVLTPAYVNPENEYRYYRYSQIQLVSSIQFFVEMDIPLTELHQFINGKNGTINLREQVSYGINSAEEKLEKIKKQISKAKELRDIMVHSDHVRFANRVVSNKQLKKICAAIPISRPSPQQYYDVLFQLLSELKKAGIQTDCEVGMLCKKSSADSSIREYFVFAEIPSDSKLPSQLTYIELPKCIYHSICISSAKFCDNTDFYTLVPSTQQYNIVLLTEIFGSDFNYRQPDFELRWF